ncbi:uncharacterized protein MICPUCDRAFT_47657 [Micromonas pusilla CCMP1545]|uniref:Predicted protein n=1 Tax=Micromonas pusilla (strain CCMP1545) TaxID=564608 RepID=C1MWX0_MICPC|nr:uncharacterized protein MICPUCDRAFT_47657 [Micromonas pusilla CCMP1545]EEH55656.1 predicted protein [Micromonas pusilla CCMP1545]|eukprot:XP_003059704.1 predicted protein [Micromonas pusilla CCMP1545]
MWRVQCNLPPRAVEVLRSGGSHESHGGMNAERSTAWVTRGNVVLAWPLPKTPCELEGGAAPESCAEYYANGGERPIVYVTRSSKDGALLMTSAGGASSGGVVTVTRCDANGGTFRELGAASLPGAPAVTAVASIPSPTGGVVAAVGCADGELYLLECPPNGGELIVKRADRDAETGGGGGGGATTPSRLVNLAMSASKAALRFIKPSTAHRSIRSIAFARSSTRGGGSMRLLVLTATSTEEWEVSRDGDVALGETHEVLPAIKSALQSDGDLEIASIAAGDGDDATVLCRDGARWSIHVGERRRGGGAFALLASTIPPAGSVPAGGAPGARATVHVGGAPRESALVVTSGGGAALFAGSTLQEQLLLHDPAAGGGGVLAAAPAPELGGWLLLTELMGVVAYAPTAPAPPSPIKRSPSPAPPPEPRDSGPSPTRFSPRLAAAAAAAASAPRATAADAAREEAEAAVRNEFAAYVAGHGAAPSECGFRLRAAGALGGSLDGTEGGDVDGGVGAFAACSRAIVDALPKHWPGPDGPGPGVELHLDEKARRHDVFLRFLVEASGVWQLLAASEREAILEHGEMVSALLCVRSLHNEAAEMAETGADRERGSDALALLLEAATTAGAALQASDAAVRGRPAVEVCYSRATGAADALLPALADGLERHAGARARASLHERAAALDALSRALLGALSSASDFRRHHASLYPPAGAGAVAPPPRWNAGEGARMALTAAADAAAALRDEAARGGAPDLASPLGSQLYALAAPLLDATAAHVASAPLGSAERAMARDEYARARASVLPALMNAARASDGGFGGFASGDFASGPFAVTMDAVAAVAEAHFGYEQLAEVCETAMAHAARVGDGAAIDGAVARTHHHMRTLRGAAEDGECTFATFMFHRMMTNPGYHSGVGARVAEMLQDTPDEFYGELGECLKPHPPLLWLHQLRADDYVGAAGTLHGLSVSGASGGGNASVREQAQYLSLAKLSLLAGGAPADADDVVAIDAALDLAKIQSALSARRKVGSADASSPPLPPLKLVEACLGDSAKGASEDDLIDAFSVFASAGGEFREANKSLLEVCWRRAAAETDWSELGALGASGGDAAYVRALAATPVARAARRCYDPSYAVRLGPPFDEVITPENALKLLEEALGGEEASVEPLRAALSLGISAR